MKTSFKTFLFVVLGITLLSACQKKSTDNHDHHGASDFARHPLYKEVMAIHDEVMPKMDDLYRLKRTLQTRLEMPGISEDEKEEITVKITQIDSASEGMMVWMREFNPPDDSSQYEAYLEAERVKVTKVRQDILDALESAQ